MAGNVGPIGGRNSGLKINNSGPSTSRSPLPTIPRTIRWVGPFANTNNTRRHYMNMSGKYKYYPTSNTLKVNNKRYTNARSKFSHLPV